MHRVLILLALLASATHPIAAQTFDVVIAGGRVLDGTGNVAFRADVGIVGERIVAVGNLADAQRARTVDATGLFVAPGFIDIHSHATTALTSEEVEGRYAHNLITQGITTVAGASDGSNAVWPLAEEIAAYRRGPGIALNVLPMVGHTTIRSEVLADDFRREATRSELDRMADMVRQGMEDGAWGLGAGLEGDVGRFSTTDELIALNRVVADFDGAYIAHQRSDQGGKLPGWMLPSDLDEWPVADSVDWGLDAIRETIRIAEQTGVRAVASHVKAAGRASWGRSEIDVRLVREARDQGHEVYLDIYPYSVIGGGARPLIPRWAFDAPTAAGHNDGAVGQSTRENLRTNLADPAARRLIERDMEYLIDISGGADKLVIIDHPDPFLIGRWVETVAYERGISAIELLIDFALNGYDLTDVPEGAWVRGSAVHETDIERYLQQDFTATASDAGIVDVPGGYDRGPPSHPRYYGAFVRRIARYVKDRQTTTLPYAIRAGTSLPAQIMGVRDRGLIREGLYADVIVFNLEEMRDRATTVHSKNRSSGIEYVLVNGAIVVAEGDLTRTLSGKVLLKEEGLRPVGR